MSNSGENIVDLKKIAVVELAYKAPVHVVEPAANPHDIISGSFSKETTAKLSKAEVVTQTKKLYQQQAEYLSPKNLIGYISNKINAFFRRDQHDSLITYGSVIKSNQELNIQQIKTPLIGFAAEDLFRVKCTFQNYEILMLSWRNVDGLTMPYDVDDDVKLCKIGVKDLDVDWNLPKRRIHEYFNAVHLKINFRNSHHGALARFAQWYVNNFNDPHIELKAKEINGAFFYFIALDTIRNNDLKRNWHYLQEIAEGRNLRAHSNSYLDYEESLWYLDHCPLHKESRKVIQLTNHSSRIGNVFAENRDTISNRLSVLDVIYWEGIEAAKEYYTNENAQMLLKEYEKFSEEEILEETAKLTSQLYAIK